MERILVVDDDPANLSMVRRILRSYPYELSFASNGEDALQITRSFAPDLIILDIMMEGINGYDVCRLIKNNPETSQIMILLLSGKSSISDRLEGYRVKADDFMAKPFDHEELVARVSILLRLKSAIDKARAAEKRKADFLAVMSHEIRNPLSGMVGMLELLNTQNLDQEQLDAVRSIRSNADALLGLINGILDFSKLEAGKTELSSSDFNLFAVLDDLNDILAVKAGKKGVNYGCIVESNVPEDLSGDVGRLRQILLNLGGNAVKFTDEGEVCIHISLERQDGEEATLKFRVIDSGIGIDPAVIPRLFQSYHQADETIPERFGGTGLGLSIARDLARLMGGDITVQSTPGKGSEFTAVLCFSNRHTGHFGKVIPGTIRLLYADPGSVSRKAMTELCKRWAWDYTCVTSCAEAQEAMKKGAYHAVLVSDDLPDRTAMSRECAERAMDMGVMVGRVLSFGQTPDMTDDLDSISSAFFRPVKAGRLLDWLSSRTRQEETFQANKDRLANRKAPLPEAFQSNLRVLLADDHDMSRKVIERMLTKLGCAVTTALNGNEALEAFSQDHFDLVFMDSQMPVMDGMEATRRIRLFESGGRPDPKRRVPIIALTGQSMEKDKEPFMAAGADDYAVKPMTINRLKDIITKNTP